MKKQKYSEADLIKMFHLNRFSGKNSHLLMHTWTDVTTTLSPPEQYLFDEIFDGLAKKIVFWNEDMLKMNFIAFVIYLGHLKENERFKTFYESMIEATVENQFLRVKTDMVIATGMLETPDVPYFYFQEYKKVKEPKADVAGQLIEAFLIAQEKNQNNKPLYGCTVLGREWEFYVMQGKNYYVSDPYQCTQKEDLLQIIAILRKFKYILETELLD
jgi:hypothetical protein